MKYLFLFFIFIFSASDGYSQDYLKKNEYIIISFSTPQGKRMVVACDKENRYIVYRFGKKNKPEFEFPGDLTKSFFQFTYSRYSRGGGPVNEGIELKNLTFINEHFRYVIYDNWYSVDDSHEVGIKVIDLKTKKQSVIEAAKGSVTGSLGKLGEMEQIQVSNELFE